MNRHMRRLHGCRSAAVLAVAGALILASAGAGADDMTSHSRQNCVTQAVQKTRAGIVTITVPRTNAKDLVGTGVIVDERGYIVTNRHIVGGKKSVSVRLHDGADLQAAVVHGDSATDLAIVHVSADTKLPALALAPVTDLMIGETVIAIGHPFGFTNTVSSGIISALDRQLTMPTGDVLRGLIQTDASINPGNSGGPLLNINGEVIGINVALREGAQGIAFAINADTVKEVLRKHLSAGRVAGVAHGLECEDKVIGETGERQRVVVAGAADGAAAADVKPGDHILAVGDRQVRNRFDLERALWDKKPGQHVELKVVRGGQQLSVILTLRAADASSSRDY